MKHFSFIFLGEQTGPSQQDPKGGGKRKVVSAEGHQGHQRHTKCRPKGATAQRQQGW